MHCTKFFLYHDDDDYKEIDNKRKQIRNVYVTLLNYALKHGYAFNRWKKIINFLPEKDPVHPKIHRLQIIHILEWDYNLILSVKWRELVHHMEDNKLFTDYQFSS